MLNRYLFVLLLVWVTGCKDNRKESAEEPHVLSVTDVHGNDVVLKKPAEKIVCLFDPMVDAIYMLQMQHKLVGIPAETYIDKELFTYYSLIDERILEKSIATPGTNETSNLESILALRPDLVIAQHMSDGTIATLKKMGVAVYLASSHKYEQVLKELTDLGVLTGAGERANFLVNYVEAQFQQMKSAGVTTNEAAKKTVYFTWANGRIFATTGRNSMMNDCLVFAGVVNVCTADVDQPNINAETLVSWNPDMIVMWNDPAALFYKKKELAGINAVRQKKIFNLMPMFFYNPHTIKSLTASVRIKGWSLEEPNEVTLQTVKKIMITFYGETAGNKLMSLL